VNAPSENPSASNKKERTHKKKKTEKKKEISCLCAHDCGLCERGREGEKVNLVEESFATNASEGG
jgi:hypothetical protein